jgi:hypothetical protein
MRRVRPGENLKRVAAEQFRSWLRHAPAVPPDAPPPIVSFDAGYDSVPLSLDLADAPLCLLVRLRAGRCFSADPTTQALPGRPRRHGAQFVCEDPTPGRSRPTSGPATTRRMGTSSSRRGAGCMPSRSAMRAAAPAPSPMPARWCAAR